jgi:small subunit ribosomal protein S17
MSDNAVDKTPIVRTMTGRVVSDKMDKTITVLIERKIKHPLYGKYMRRSKKIHVHDESNNANMGDTVIISSIRPKSKTKTFTLVEVVTRATGI